MATLHDAGEAHLKSLIDAGKYNTADNWSFSADDGNALLGKDDDWDRYGSVHLGEEPDTDAKTKAHWKYPAAKAKGDGEEVFRSGLVAAKDRAGQQKDGDIEAAAGRLIDLFDKKEGPDKKESARAAVRDLPRVMTRIVGTPLLIAKAKLDVIMATMGPRLGLAIADPTAATFKAMFDSDDDDNDPEDMPYALTADGIALLNVDGTLVYKSGWLGALSGLTAYGDIRAAFDQAVADPQVKGILLCVDSYGGEVNGCFDLADAIFAARSAKPVYAVAADDAYSAAYAILAAASKVFVSRTSGVGSVGVVALHVDQSAADKAEGLNYTYIYSGDRKVDGNPHAPLTDAATENMQAQCDRLRGLFAASVARYRGLPVDDVMATQAGCFYGEQAVGAKFADAMGTPDDALGALRAALSAPPIDVGPTPGAPASDGIPISGEKPDAVIDLNAMREKLRGEVTENHVETIELCRLAGRSDLAAGFIRASYPLDRVRTELQAARAAAADARVTSGHIVPDAAENDAQQIAAGWDKAFAAATGSPRKSRKA